jgi:serine protease Do
MLHRIPTLLCLASLTLFVRIGLSLGNQSVPAHAEDSPGSASYLANAISADTEPPKPTAVEQPAGKQSLSQPVSIGGSSNGTNQSVSAFTKIAPESISDLQSIQAAIEDVVKKGLPATVGVDVGERMGSGVIVTADGFVLTVGHVAGGPGREAFVVLPSGRVLHAKTLGSLDSFDAGMIKITEVGPWPHVDMGRSGTLNSGAWCVTLGYPGGFKLNHTPTVRAGRVISVRSNDIWTDCPLLAGDSGGPLFNLQGQVIGIHSGIDDPVIYNFHVPVDAFRDAWSRFTAGDHGEPARGAPMLGIGGKTQSDGCRVVSVSAGGSAEKTGLKVDDVVTHLSGEMVDSIEALQVIVAKHKVGDEVTLSVIRDGNEMQLTATLLKRE